jgi:hypothetical protein
MVVHPITADFQPGFGGRILISALHDNTYRTTINTTTANTPAQTSDGLVVISAYLQEKKAGVRVYFEVIDPDDPVDQGNPSYVEDLTPLTEFLVGDEAAVNQDPNDNRDPERSMFVGSIGAYHSFQTQMQSGSADTVIATINGVERAVAEVYLTITSRYAGDNYIVRATCIDPDDKPFNDKSGVTDGSANAQIPESEIRQTALLTAWKRMYVEVDKMFRNGTDLTDTSGSGQPDAGQIHVPTGSGLGQLDVAVGDTVQIFDTAAVNQVAPYGEIRTVTAVSATDITVDADLIRDYTVERNAHVGKLTDMSNPAYAAFYEVDTSAIVDLWATAFVEVFFNAAAQGGVVPFTPDIAEDDLEAFAALWFYHEGSTDDSGNSDMRNYYHIIGAHAITSNSGATYYGYSVSSLHWGYTCVQTIISDYAAGDAQKVIVSVTTHEFTHMFDKAPVPAKMTDFHHVGADAQAGVVPSATYFCTMNKVRDLTLPVRWCLFHVYANRDQAYPN